MGNRITEKYFNYSHLGNIEKTTLKEISDKIKFIPKTEIFRGQIYDRNKVGSLIYAGKWKENIAVLKIQLLKTDIDEIDIIDKFNKQNQSSKIRLPLIYQAARWSKNMGYGYLLMEFIQPNRIYNPPFASVSQIKNFCSLYQEYKTKCLYKPFIKREKYEKSSLEFATRRVAHWLKIAETKGSLTKTNKVITERFISLAKAHLPSVKMQFMHGHFTYDDIFKVAKGKYVLMSNLFWSYRPEFYDCTFHLWASIKSIRDQNIYTNKIVKYIQSWVKEYKKLPVIKGDFDFARKFNIMMAERTIGALLIDIHNQYYLKKESAHKSHLTKLFRGLFYHYNNLLE